MQGCNSKSKFPSKTNYNKSTQKAERVASSKLALWAKTKFVEVKPRALVWLAAETTLPLSAFFARNGGRKKKKTPLEAQYRLISSNLDPDAPSTQDVARVTVPVPALDLNSDRPAYSARMRPCALM